YSWGSEPTHDGTLFYPPVRSLFPPSPEVRPQNPRPFNQRNEALGGYLEGRINTRFPITRWVDFDPYGIISVSFGDRTEPGGVNPYGGHPLTGWNHVQAGRNYRFIWPIWEDSQAPNGRLPTQTYISCRSERIPTTFQIHRRARTATNDGVA